MSREMKDSGYNWIGEIPRKWNTAHFKAVCNMYTGNSIKHSDKANYEDSTEAMPYIATKDVDADLNRIAYMNGMFVKIKDDTFKTAPAGSVLICVEGGSAGKKIAFTDRDVSFVNKLCCVHSETQNTKYVYYYMKSPAFTNEFNSNITGLIGGVSIGLFKQHVLPLPPKVEQLRIATFLDEKVGQIDSIIEKTKQSIEEYKKYKQCLITETVTKGLNPAVPMKDSGIEWIGEVPAHWRISKIKWEFDNLDNRRKPIDAGLRNHNAEILYDYYGASGVIDKIDSYIFDEDLILIGEDGANLMMRNLPIIYIAKGKYWVNNHAHVLKPINDNDLEYMAFQLEITDLTNFITGSTQPKLAQSNLNIIGVIVPPVAEQRAITECLTFKCQKLDDAISKKLQLLLELESYKKSLIYEYVTGKKEVQ